jgi:hypothetical protein
VAANAVVANAEKVREPLRLFGAEADDSARLTPRFFKRVSHVSDETG